MIVGRVGEWISILKPGEAVIIEMADMRHSAQSRLDSAFDYVRPEDVDAVVAEINSEEYPEHSITERMDGTWNLRRHKQLSNHNRCVMAGSE